MDNLEKFKVFKYHHLLTRVGFFSLQFRDKSKPFWKLCAPFYILLSLIAFTISCFAFVHQNDVDFSETLRSYFHIIAVTQSIGMFFSYGINMSKIQDVHHRLQGFVDQAGKSLHILLLFFTPY